jgi:hypothetical protein
MAAVYGHGDSGCEAIAVDRGDFSPVFWLAGAAGGGGEPPLLSRISLAYPLLIGAFLVAAFAAQRSLF